MCVDKKRNRIGRTLILLTAGAILAGLMAASAGAQSFTLSQNGKGIGSASLSLRPGSATSGAKIDMPGLKYSFNETAQLDPGYHLVSVKLSGSVNGSNATVNAQPQGQQVVMHINANNQVINTPLTMHPNAVFFPDFDPAALQTMLYLGAAQNNRDLWALVPKQTGSVAAIRLVTNADMQGTLNGAPITVHHFTASYGATKAEVFSSPRNELLQAEWTDEGFAMVRQGFKLTPPAKPTAPPPAKPADAQQPQGQAPAQPKPQAQPQPQ